MGKNETVSQAVRQESKADRDRRFRMEGMLHPLTLLASFTSSDAVDSCQETSAAYLETTLKRLADDGVLVRVLVSGSEMQYRWNDARPIESVNRWIEGQIHGLQIKEMPPEERPRERLLRDGAASLSNSDLLAILIRVGVRGESAVQAGQRLSNHLGSEIENLIQYSRSDLKGITPAITSASYATLMAGIELGRRIAKRQSESRLRPVRITSTREAIEYCREQFHRLAHDRKQEEFHIVSLDTKHSPIRSHLITRGTLDASLVHPREVFRAAIADSAAAVILVHNHPSGDATPSREDHQVTHRLTEAGKLIGIHVLDHIVVASERCMSIREATP